MKHEWSWGGCSQGRGACIASMSMSLYPLHHAKRSSADLPSSVELALWTADT